MNLSTGYGSSLNVNKMEDNKENKKKVDVKIIISTEVNGRTIAQRTEKVPSPPLIVFTEQYSHSNSIDERTITMSLAPPSILKQNNTAFEQDTEWQNSSKDKLLTSNNIGH